MRVALAAAMRVSHRNTPITAASGGVLTRIIEGLVLVRNDPKLIGTLTITVIYNVFGWPFTSMIPVIGQDNLHLGAGGIGILASMDGIGAFCGSIALMLWAKPKHYARLYVGGVVLYLVLLILFALVPNVPMAGAALLFTGVCNAAFSVMQATLIYLAAPARCAAGFTAFFRCASARRRSGSLSRPAGGCDRRHRRHRDVGHCRPRGASRRPAAGGARLGPPRSGE